MVSYSRSARTIGMRGTSPRVDRRASAAGRMAVLFMVLTGAGFGCVSTQRSPFVDPSETTIHIEIDNRGWEDATVHAIWSGGRRRLGTVTGTMRADYTLALDRSVLMHFEIDLLNGPECITQQIFADPGDIILLQIDRRFLGGADCLGG